VTDSPWTSPLAIEGFAEAHRMVVASTAHMPEWYNDYLEICWSRYRMAVRRHDSAEAARALPLHLSGATRCGWLFWVPTEPEPGDFGRDEPGHPRMPGPVADVLAGAQAAGASYVLFDGDAPTVRGIETHDW